MDLSLTDQIIGFTRIVDLIRSCRHVCRDWYILTNSEIKRRKSIKDQWYKFHHILSQSYQRCNKKGLLINSITIVSLGLTIELYIHYELFMDTHVHDIHAIDYKGCRFLLHQFHHKHKTAYLRIRYFPFTQSIMINVKKTLMWNTKSCTKELIKDKDKQSIKGIHKPHENPSYHIYCCEASLFSEMFSESDSSMNKIDFEKFGISLIRSVKVRNGLWMHLIDSNDRHFMNVYNIDTSRGIWILVLNCDSMYQYLLITSDSIESIDFNDSVHMQPLYDKCNNVIHLMDETDSNSKKFTKRWTIYKTINL